MYFCFAKLGFKGTALLVIAIFSFLSLLIVVYRIDFFSVFSPKQLVSISIEDVKNNLNISQSTANILKMPTATHIKSPFNYPLYMDCYIHNYPKPIPYDQDDMLQVQDIWIWPDLTHITIEHERLSLCERNYKYEIWNRNYSCTYYKYDNKTQTFINLNIITYASTQKKQIHAQHLFIDCPIPQNSTFNFIEAVNNTFTQYIPQLFVAVAPININKTNNRFNKAGLRNSTVFLPVCLNTIGNQNNNEMITHNIIKSMNLKAIEVEEKSNNNLYRYNLSVCTMITSNSYLDARFNHSVSDAVYRVIEWIEFHLMVGFDHFFIYDNSNNDCNTNQCSKLYKVLLSYIQSGIVTYIYWPTPFCDIFFDGLAAWRRWGPQIAGFNSCIGRFGSMTKWMSIHDVDEFLVPLQPNYNDVNVLINDIQHKDDISHNINSIGFVQKLLLNCTNLKYGNHREYEDNLKMISILSHYQCSFRTLEPKNKKLLIRPLRMRSILIHFPTYFYPGFELNEYLLNSTNEGIMYHARTSSMFGKNDYYVLPPDENMLYWFDKLHARLAKQRLQKHWDQVGLNNINNNAKLYWW